MEKLPAQMTVIGISKPGGPEVLVPETRPVPAPGPNEILIKVKAASLNRADLAVAHRHRHAVGEQHAVVHEHDLVGVVDADALFELEAAA